MGWIKPIHRVSDWRSRTTARIRTGAEPADGEREVLNRLSQGYLLKEIADQLDLKYDTVKTYVGRIYEKLHVHSRDQAMIKCRSIS